MSAAPRKRPKLKSSSVTSLPNLYTTKIVCSDGEAKIPRDLDFLPDFNFFFHVPDVSRSEVRAFTSGLNLHTPPCPTPPQELTSRPRSGGRFAAYLQNSNTQAHWFVDLDLKTLDITPMAPGSTPGGIRHKIDELSSFYIRERCDFEKTIKEVMEDSSSEDERPLRESKRSKVKSKIKSKPKPKSLKRKEDSVSNESPSKFAMETPKGLKVIYPQTDQSQEDVDQIEDPENEKEEAIEATGGDSIKPEEGTKSEEKCIPVETNTSAKDESTTSEKDKPVRVKKLKKRRSSVWIKFQELRCCYCPFVLEDRRVGTVDLVRHIKAEHSHQLYVCPGLGCTDSYFYLPNSLRRHITRKHSNEESGVDIDKLDDLIKGQIAIHQTEEMTSEDIEVVTPSAPGLRRLRSRSKVTVGNDHGKGQIQSSPDRNEEKVKGRHTRTRSDKGKEKAKPPEAKKRSKEHKAASAAGSTSKSTSESKKRIISGIGDRRFLVGLNKELDKEGKTMYRCPICRKIFLTAAECMFHKFQRHGSLTSASSSSSTKRRSSDRNKK